MQSGHKEEEEAVASPALQRRGSARLGGAFGEEDGDAATQGGAAMASGVVVPVGGDGRSGAGRRRWGSAGEAAPGVGDDEGSGARPDRGEGR